MIKIPDLKIEEPTPIGIDFKKMMSDSYVDPREKIKPQPVAVSIGYSEYKGTNYPIPFGSYGNFSCIVGASKSRKTFFESMITSGYIGGNSSQYVPSIRGHNQEEKYVIRFDTEQAKYHAKRVVDRIGDMVGAHYEGLKTYALRGYAPNERFEFIDYIVNESEYRHKIGLISIDGYVDLCTDFNSLEQATNLTDKLLQWTNIHGLEQSKQCHITGILHKNFGSSKPVGHVGSSVLKKAETIVFVEKERGSKTSKVTCEYSRNIEFEEINFGVNKEWLPYEMEAEVTDDKSIFQ